MGRPFDALGNLRSVDLPDGRHVEYLVESTFWTLRPSAGYAGGLYDADTGLVRFGARDYDAETGRWLSKEPAIFGDGTNAYAYAQGDPISKVDPNGERTLAQFLSPAIGPFWLTAQIDPTNLVGHAVGIASSGELPRLRSRGGEAYANTMLAADAIHARMVT